MREGRNDNVVTPVSRSFDYAKKCYYDALLFDTGFIPFYITTTTVFPHHISSGFFMSTYQCPFKTIDLLIRVLN